MSTFCSKDRKHDVNIGDKYCAECGEPTVDEIYLCQQCKFVMSAYYKTKYCKNCDSDDVILVKEPKC